MSVSVAIDGPAGAGKSSLSRLAAKAMGYIYIDTGAIYRTIGLAAIKCGIDSKNSLELDGLLKDIQVDMFLNEKKEQVIMLNGEEVSAQIRTPEVSMAASAISAVPKVRAFLLDLQRSFAERYDVLMDGRDIGTVILPNADVKIFLTASPEARASRRYKELTEAGTQVEYDDVLQDVITRDYNDMNREIAPLKQAEDAILLDTTKLNFEESLAAILDIIKEKLSL